MTVEHILLIQKWGYWLMFGAAIIEGETLLIIGGTASASGMLDPLIVILLSILGCIIHDSFCFYFGRFLAPNFLFRRSSWKSKIQKVTLLLEKYDFWLILGFRFLYGFRIIIPFSLGISNISSFKFFFLDLIGSIIWVLIFVSLGYYFSGMISELLRQLFSINFIGDHWFLLVCTLSFIIFITILILKKN